MVFDLSVRLRDRLHDMHHGRGVPRSQCVAGRSRVVARSVVLCNVDGCLFWIPDVLRLGRLQGTKMVCARDVARCDPVPGKLCHVGLSALALVTDERILVGSVVASEHTYLLNLIQVDSCHSYNSPNAVGFLIP
jgi:hypothetical protein